MQVFSDNDLHQVSYNGDLHLDAGFRRWGGFKSSRNDDLHQDVGFQRWGDFKSRYRPMKLEVVQNANETGHGNNKVGVIRKPTIVVVVPR